MYNQTFIQRLPPIERSLTKASEKVFLNYCKIVLHYKRSVAATFSEVSTSYV